MKNAILFVTAMLFIGTGCGRRAPQPDTSATSDSLRAVAAAESALAAAAPKLEWWTRRWTRFVPGFTLDSLRLVGTTPVPWAAHGVPHEMWESDLDRQLFGEPSPDSTFVVYPDVYRRDGGEIELSPEPDSWAMLVDTKRDSAWTLERCGTMCLFERAVWVGPRAFALTQLVEDSDDASHGRGELVLFDLERRTRTAFRTPPIANLAEARAAARSELEDYYRERLVRLRGARPRS